MNMNTMLTTAVILHIIILLKRYDCVVLLKKCIYTVYMWPVGLTAILLRILLCSLWFEHFLFADCSRFSNSLYTYNTDSDSPFDSVDDDYTFAGNLSNPYILYGSAYNGVYVSRF